MLVELGLMEQRLDAVKEVFDNGATVTDVARRYGVARQTVHEWLRRFATHGLPGLIDASSRPLSCPHQMPVVVEARIVELRREHPSWGPRTIGHRLAKEGIEPLPGRSSIYRCGPPHLITPDARKRRRLSRLTRHRSIPGDPGRFSHTTQVAPPSDQPGGANQNDQPMMRSTDPADGTTLRYSKTTDSSTTRTGHSCR